jgi:hypothetical protein
MVGFVCAVAAFAMSDTQVVQSELTLQYQKPSRLVNQLRQGKNFPSSLQITFDDLVGNVRLSGKVADVVGFHGLLASLDVQRQPIRLHLKIESPVDRFGYEATLKLAEGQMWKMSDTEIGLTVSLAPRLIAAGELETSVYLSDQTGTQQMRFRLKPGESHEFTMPGSTQDFWIPVPVWGHIPFYRTLPGPKVTLTYPKP